MLERDEAVRHLVEVIEYIQEKGGKQKRPITPDTCPLNDLDEFDSPNAVEAGTFLDERLGLNLSGNYLFAINNTPCTIAQIADQLCALKNGGRAARNG